MNNQLMSTTASHVSQRAQMRGAQLRLRTIRLEDQVKFLIQMGTLLPMGIMVSTSIHTLLMEMLTMLVITMIGEIDYQKSDSQPVGSSLFITIIVKQMILYRSLLVMVHTLLTSMQTLLVGSQKCIIFYPDRRRGI